MKKLLTVLLTVLMACTLVACSSNTKTETESGPVESETTDGTAESTSGEVPEVKTTYADYVNAEDDTEVEVLMYVQAHQSWWENEGVGQLTIYGVDEETNGGYFVYNAQVDEATANALVEGTLIKVTGVKSTWAGEPEIIDATVEMYSNPAYVSEPVDLTDKFNDEEALYEYVNQKAKFTSLTVAGMDDGAAFWYGYDNSGSQGDDLYFNLTNGETTYTFVIESYLCDKDSDVYQTVEALQVDALVDVECFMYWYEGMNAHVTSVTSAH